MAYTPNANREVRNGVAKVSAQELADFRQQYGADKTLRDLLNMDKGMQRRGDAEQAAQKAASLRSMPVQATASSEDTNRAAKSAAAAREAQERGSIAETRPLSGKKLSQGELNSIYQSQKYADGSMKKGGAVRSASSRADGIAQRGKTKGTIVMCGGGYMKGKK